MCGLAPSLSQRGRIRVKYIGYVILVIHILRGAGGGVGLCGDTTVLDYGVY
jgi:hypothetical protein